jgi:hypothetical protein
VACEVIASVPQCGAQSACVWVECTGTPKPCPSYSESSCPLDSGCKLGPPLDFARRGYRGREVAELKSGFTRCIE